MGTLPSANAVITPELGDGSTYTIRAEIYQGAMAYAYDAVDNKTGKRVFLKAYISPSDFFDWYRNYIDYVKEINSKLASSEAGQYCVKTMAAFEARVNRFSVPSFFQVFEFIEGGHDLQTLLKKAESDPMFLKWSQRVTMAKVFLASMRAIHNARIIHCDLKPENVQMLPVSTMIGLRPLIIDMDRSILAYKQAPWHGKPDEGYVGTPNYFSPEHLTGVKPILGSDVFTSALIIYELLGGGHPYRSSDAEVYKKNVLAGRPPSIEYRGHFDNPQHGDNFKKLLLNALSPIAKERPTMEGLHKALLPVVAKDREIVPPPTTLPPPPLPPPPVSNIQIEGPNGVLEFRLSTQVGAALLQQVSVEAKYASNPQFEVKKESGGWYIIPNSAAANPTLLNGAVISEKTQLKNASVISLGSRNDTSRQAMRVTIKLT